MDRDPADTPEPRLLRPEDLVAVQELIYRTIDTCYAGVYPPAAVAFFKKYHSRDSIMQDAAAGTTLVLERDGRIVGCGALVGSTIKRVFVDPGFQHSGLGRQIMARLERAARDAGLVETSLDASLPSRRLYDFLGYRGETLGRREVAAGQFLEYYPMVKKLG